MTNQNAIAHEISYAHSARTRGGRTVIRTLENLTGRIGLIKRADGYAKEVTEGRDFWLVMKERYGLQLDIIGGSLDNIPRKGPLLLVANHPYGILDGLIMGHILSETRDDFRILANHVFHKAEDLNRIVLPVSFDTTKEAIKLNLQTRKQALELLHDGGAIGIFPGGTVSTALSPFGQPRDPEWRSFTARMVAKSHAKVVPIYFDGHTSRLFQIASHLHVTLRMGFLIYEFKKRVDTPVKVAIGAPLGRERLDSLAGDSKGLMDFLRQQTYGLSPTQVGVPPLGYEFDEKYRGR